MTDRKGAKTIVMIYNTFLIPGLHGNIFRMTQALQKGFQVTSESETLTLKEISTKILFNKKMANHRDKGFYFTTTFYKSAHDTAFLVPEKRKP